MAQIQGSLFPSDSDGHAQTAGLLLVARPDRPLTPAQREFNRLVARVEKLREKLATETRRLDQALKYYGEHLHPRLQRISARRKDLIRALAPFLDGKQLAKQNRKLLRLLIADQLEMTAAEGGPIDDVDLREIFSRVHGVRYEDAAREELDEVRSEMESMLADFGIDVDFSDLSPDMTPEAMAAKAAKVAAEIRQKAEEPPSQGDEPKSKRRRKQEERARQAEESRKKSIASIYKQLARVLHPDLEPDPERRERKLAFMQELTTAYHSNDLHTLLRLELQWIEREENNLDRLTDGKLAIYNRVLREQSAELKLEIENLEYDPRYQAIHVSDGPFDLRVMTDGPERARHIDMAISSIERSLERLRGKDALQEVLIAIRGFRESYRDAPF
jgi:hypothetical protein